MRREAIDSGRYRRDGYLHIPSVFGHEEVQAMRSAVCAEADVASRTGRVLKSFSGEVVPVGDLVAVRGLNQLPFDTRLVEMAKTLLDSERVVYFGDSSAMIGGKIRGFHKDNAARYDASHSDWTSPYRLLRVGIYLDDHRNNSGGLKIRVGSHVHADVESGPILAVPTMPGDIVVWNLRLTHSGHAARLRGLPDFGITPWVEERLPERLVRPSPTRRLSVFVTYAVRGAHLDSYLAKYTDLHTNPNNYLYTSWLYSDGSESVEARASAAGVDFMKPVANYGSHFEREEARPLGYIPTGIEVDRSLTARIRSAGRRVISVGRRAGILARR